MRRLAVCHSKEKCECGEASYKVLEEIGAIIIMKKFVIV